MVADSLLQEEVFLIHMVICIPHMYCVDSCVKIWSLFDSPAMANDALLAALQYHTKSVNIVRWSYDGNLLASASDDTYILVYKHSPTSIASQPFGSLAASNKVLLIYEYYLINTYTST
jgi:WD40 repeat protein